MEKFNEKLHKNLKEIYQLGFESACEGIDPTKIILKNAEEVNIFLEGYNKGLEIQSDFGNQKNVVQQSGIKRAA